MSKHPWLYAYSPEAFWYFFKWSHLARFIRRIYSQRAIYHLYDHFVAVSPRSVHFLTFCHRRRRRRPPRRQSRGPSRRPSRRPCVALLRWQCTQVPVTRKEIFGLERRMRCLLLLPGVRPGLTKPRTVRRLEKRFEIRIRKGRSANCATGRSTNYALQSFHASHDSIRLQGLKRPKTVRRLENDSNK